MALNGSWETSGQKQQKIQVFLEPPNEHFGPSCFVTCEGFAKLAKKTQQLLQSNSPCLWGPELGLQE